MLEKQQKRAVTFYLNAEDKEGMLQKMADFLTDVIARHMDELVLDDVASYDSLKVTDRILELYEEYQAMRNEMLNNKRESRFECDYSIFVKDAKCVLRMAA